MSLSAAHAINNSLIDIEKILICFSHLRWNFVYQRPQHLMSRAARDWKVYFFEEPIFDSTLTTPKLETYSDISGVTVVVPKLPVGLPKEQIVSVQRTFVDRIMGQHARSLKAFWYYTPVAVEFSFHREPDLCVYDCMDELSAFKGAAPEIVACEQRLLNVADLVFTGGVSLYEAKRGLHRQVSLFPSSVDREHFARARQPWVSDPADQEGIAKPRVGYFGVIDERLDIELIDDVAAIRPDWQFVMVGPVVKIDPSTIPRRNNIHWLGPKRYQDLPNYLAGWDAGFMPFALNESTRFISPTKTPEFLAAGISIVSTAVPDVVRGWGQSNLVTIATDAEAMCESLASLMGDSREEWLAHVDERLSGMSWDQTWSRMSGLMFYEIAWIQQIREFSELLHAPHRHSPQADLAVTAGSLKAEVQNV
ncbi:MAG: glycosyltransferase [Candidatus Binatia bacterium]